MKWRRFCKSARLTRRFGGVTAVDALDFEVAEGELVSLIGPNGAGKTTTFNLISGLDRAASGEVLFDGRRIERLAAEKIAALGIARTFQHGRVFANLSVLDNVLVGAHTRLKAARPKLGPIAELLAALVNPRGVREEQAELVEEAKAILARFGDRLTPRLDHPAYSLSYANRRRLEIARALALRPRLLLLDEPTAGMNPTETAEMEAIIGDLKAVGPDDPADRAQARHGDAAIGSRLCARRRQTHRRRAGRAKCATIPR